MITSRDPDDLANRPRAPQSVSVQIPLQLIEGDVRDVGDVACVLMGQRCPLKRLVTEETSKNFVRPLQKYSNVPLPFEVLSAPDYRWPLTLAVDFRSNNKLTFTRFFGLHLALLHALRVGPKTGSIVIMPLSARNPDYVALGTIFALWCIHYHRRSAVLGYREVRKTIPTFKIVSNVGIQRYEAVLADDYARMWSFIESVLAREDLDPFVAAFASLLTAPEFSWSNTPSVRSHTARLQGAGIRFDVQ